MFQFFKRSQPMMQPAAVRRRSARLQLEVLEERLALSWAGVPPTSITPPTSAVTVILNAQSDATGTATIASSENDYYTLVAPVTGSYRISALTPNSNLNTVLGVFGATGARLTYNDNISFLNRDSRVTISLTAGDRYYFGITNYTGTAGGSYTWQVDGPAPVLPDDSFENNDSFSQAANLGTLTTQRTVSGLIFNDSADWFRFTTSGPGTATNSISISFQNTQGNLELELYNSTNQRLGMSATTGNTETISLNGLVAGTYYIRVYGFQGAFNPSYTLNILPPSAPPPPTTGAYDIAIRSTGLTASQLQIFEQAAARWEQIIVGDVPDATYQTIAVDDILIDAQSSAIDGPGGVLGQAGPDWVRSGSYLPIHGVMTFDSADLAAMEANGQLYDVILHEMGHVLGIGTIWQAKGLLAGAGTTNPVFLGTRATAEYNALFGTSGTSVPVEGLPSGSGSRDSHWRESIFGNELMTPYISGTPNPISRVTVASLADLGYTVNMNAADVFLPPGSSVSGTGSTTGLVSGNSPALTTLSGLQGFLNNPSSALDHPGTGVNQAALGALARVQNWLENHSGQSETGAGRRVETTRGDSEPTTNFLFEGIAFNGIASAESDSLAGCV